MAARKKSSVRKGRRFTAQATERSAPGRKQRIIGMGQFDSGLPDLATNKKYMEDFGLSRSEIVDRERM